MNATPSILPSPLPSIDTMRRAFAAKDVSYDGTFFVAVKTTGVFCRPVCKAKPPRVENIEFFPTPREAMYHGYRPCKLCHPLDHGARPPALVKTLMRLIDEAPTRRLTSRELRDLKIDAVTARRQFRAYCGETFSQYQRARRMGAALKEIRGGSNVTRAQVGAGFDSGSGFREAFARMFGTRASDARDVNTLSSTWLTTPLGPMLAVASDEGIVLLDFVDRKGLERAIERLRRRFGTRAGRGTPGAVIVPGEHRHLSALQTQLAEYFAGKRREFTLPLVIGGSKFERRAWEYLRSIPHGETRSYSQQAVAINTPRAVRAVGRANGMNYIGIVIPCHRVIGADGNLTGYGGGLARKRWLIAHEKQKLNHEVTKARSGA